MPVKVVDLCYQPAKKQGCLNCGKKVSNPNYRCDFCDQKMCIPCFNKHPRCKICQRAASNKDKVARLIDDLVN